jgi:hydrogenase maturation protease
VSTCVVGVGNAFRGDDAVGLEVVRMLEDVRVFECEGEPVSLLDTWEGFERVLLVDAMRSGAPAGTIRRIVVADEPLPPELRRASTHLLGVGEAVELARALGRLPNDVVVYAIEGERWQAGAELSAAVAAAAAEVAAAIQAEVSA